MSGLLLFDFFYKNSYDKKNEKEKQSKEILV